MKAIKQTADRFGHEIECASVSFVLMREDDNGVRFCVQRFSRRSKAERKMRDLVQGGHKRLFWVNQDD
jgi:hypothetical protein